LDALRDAAQHVSKAARLTFKRLKLPYALKLEISSEECEGREYLPHVHALVNVPDAGRGYVSMLDWHSEWLDALPEWLQSSDCSPHVERVRDLDKASTYLSKHPFAQCADESEATIRRIIDGIFATKGIQKFDLRRTCAG
jgi:hypothetical protein